jgi:hypothetical protein
VNDGRFISRKFLGYGGHFSGDVKPRVVRLGKDDFLFSFVAGEAIGDYFERRVEQRRAAGDQFHRPDRLRDTTTGLYGRDSGVEHSLQHGLRIQHKRRLPALVVAEPALDDSDRNAL